MSLRRQELKAHKSTNQCQESRHLNHVLRVGALARSQTPSDKVGVLNTREIGPSPHTVSELPPPINAPTDILLFRKKDPEIVILQKLIRKKEANPDYVSKNGDMLASLPVEQLRALLKLAQEKKEKERNR
jgi:hypothetical protein